MVKNIFALKSKITFLLVLGAVFLCLGLLNLADRIRWNDKFDGISWTESDKGVVVTKITGENVPAEVKPGDLLLRVNQHEILGVEDYTDVLFLLTPDKTAVYELEDRMTHEKKTAVVPISSKPILTIKDFYKVVSAFVYLFIGTLILIRNWQARSGIHFYLICLFSFVLYLFSYTKQLSFLDFLVYGMSVLAVLVLPAMFLHFCLNFPVRKSWLKERTLPIMLIYVVPAVLGIIQVLWAAGWLGRIGLPRNLTSRIYLDQAHVINFIVYFIASLFILSHNRFTLQSTELRQQMKWIITGTMLAVVPFFFLNFLPLMLNMEITSLMEAAILSLVLLPISFAYAIMKYRLMDVDIIFKRGAAYLIAIATILVIYFLLISLCGLFFKYFFPGANTLAIAVSAVVASVLFAPVLKRVQQEVDRFFYKEEYKDRRSLLEIGRTLSTESSLKTITSTIMARVTKSLKVESVAIFLKTPGEEEIYDLVAHNGLRYSPPPGPNYRIPKDFLIRELHVPTLAFGMFEEPGSSWLHSLKDYYEKLSLYYFQPLVHRGEVIGVLALGKGHDGTLLTSEDIELLSMLSGYAVIALENARLHDTLTHKAQELETLKAYSENIIEGINVGVVAVNKEGIITTWNHAMESLYGMSQLMAAGQKLNDVLPSDVYASILLTIGGDTLSTEVTRNIYKLYLENARGEKKFVNLTLSPFVEVNGTIIGTLIVFDDITAKVQLEKQLLQAEKLSSLGLIAAGVAHEVNTPLTGISSFTQMLVKEVPVNHPHHGVLKKIERQCFRASEIVTNLLNFSRIQSEEFRDTDINHVLDDSLNLVDHVFRKKLITVVRDYGQNLPAVLGNEGRLMQVFVNILLNARDATPEKGRVTVRSSHDEKYVTVKIEDNGKGISPEIVHKIYDPFFTTKDTGKGTGLGLSVSYGIIQEHSGRIYVDSHPGEGTTFTIKLPTRKIPLSYLKDELQKMEPSSIVKIAP